MPLDEQQLVDRSLWMIFVALFLTILAVIYWLTELGNKETGQPVETTEVNPRERNNVYPPRPSIHAQETQEPGIHPSHELSDVIKKLKESNDKIFQESITEQGVISCQPLNQDQRQEKENVEEEQAEGAQSLEDSSQVFRHHVEGKEEIQEKDKKKASPEEEEPSGAEAALESGSVQRAEEPAPAQDGIKGRKKPPKAETTLELEETNVPGDVDRSLNPSSTQPEASAAEVRQDASSDEGPSATGNIAKRKRKKRRRRKKAEGKGSFNEGSSCDEASVMEDPETSTDESHHSSTEVFSSGYQQVLDGHKEQTACNEKGNEKKEK